MPQFCTTCKGRPVKRRRDGTYPTRCAFCAERRNAKARAARARNIKLGVCTYEGGCDKPAVMGKLCKKHRLRARALRRAQYAASLARQ